MPEQAARQLLSSWQLDRYQHLAAQTYADRNPLMQWCATCPDPCLLTSSPHLYTSALITRAGQFSAVSSR